MTIATQETITHELNASGKRLGRLASEIAILLMGKNRADVVKNQTAPVKVVVTHASKLLIDEKKRQQKTYVRYSGYPGGQKTATMNKVIADKGYSEVLRKAVYGMLPSNRLRALRMKQLTVSE
jgi:large subunit ribosomal protein L13